VFSGMLRSYSDKSYFVHAPVVWNSLPVDLQSPDWSLDTFNEKLKTFFSELSSSSAFEALENITYLRKDKVADTP